MINKSFWIDTMPEFGNGSLQLEDGHYDVAIIGGGLTGLSAALALAKQGAKVGLFEAKHIMQNASGQNGGQCSSGVVQDFGGLANKIGMDKAKRYYNAYSDAVDSLRKVIKDEGIECEVRESGKLKLASKPHHAEKIFNTCELIRKEVDTNVEFFDADKIKEEIKSDRFYGGMVQRNGFQLHVGKLGIGLANSAVKNGAHIYENSPVTKIDNTGNQFRITTPKGQVTAKDVVVASGISEHGPFGWFRRRIVPVGSFIIMTEQISPDLIEELMPNKRSYVTSKNIGNYFRVHGEDRLLFGGRVRFAASNAKEDAISGKMLIESMEELFPQLKGVKASHCWGGLIDMTPNRLPKAGMHKGMFYAMGYSGHGVQMSTYMGQQLAEMVAGNKEANPWRDERWFPIPAYNGKPWFLPMVGAYYKLQDYLH